MLNHTWSGLESLSCVEGTAADPWTESQCGIKIKNPPAKKIFSWQRKTLSPSGKRIRFECACVCKVFSLASLDTLLRFLPALVMLSRVWAYSGKMSESEKCAGIPRSRSQINADFCLLIQPVKRWVMDFGFDHRGNFDHFYGYFLSSFANTHIILWHVVHKPVYTRSTHTCVCTHRCMRTHS